MDLKELEQYLYAVNAYEQKQRETGVSINDYVDYTHSPKQTYIDPGRHILRLPKNMFFQKGQNIFISKHNRFAPMQEHLHDFIELNYVYAGRCTEYINGKRVDLEAGDFCVLDRNVPHAIDPLGVDDILINILINEETFSSLFMVKMENNSSLQAVILTDMFQKQAKHDRYVLFKTEQFPRVHLLVQLFLTEYWSEERQMRLFLTKYLELIIMELMRIYSYDQLNRPNSAFDYEAVLNYIDDHYLGLTLSDLARNFGYNKNYLGNALKKATGRTFQAILLEKRLSIACSLLMNTDYSIELVAEKAGFNSASYFFRQFKKRFNETPNDFRRGSVKQKTSNNFECDD
ncbi:AraC family transcriptional regulator [Lactobacillus equicursoris]|uniref:AraC family transcriptional regulator n=1 Tax=Lactobacillus equicursoris TaxID=420645 RepID=UPI0039969D14